MTLPDGLQQLTTYEEVRAAWGDTFTIAPETEGEEGTVLFAGNPRVAITVDAVFVQLKKPVKAGPNLELTDILRIEEPEVSALRVTDKYKGDMEKAICLLSTICQIPNAETNKMKSSDFNLCGEVVGAFL